MSGILPIYRDKQGIIELVGFVDIEARVFSYDAAYVIAEGSTALSFSPPLRREPYSEVEFRPYFEGLLPEGPALRALTQSLGIREDDYLTVLSDCGLDCVGDVVVNPEAYCVAGKYEPLSLEEIGTAMAGMPSITDSGIVSRASLAGT